METSTYVALSGQLALDRRMAALAQNIANARTAGYRAQIVDFKSLLANTGVSDTAFAATGKEFVSTEAGGLVQTKSPLDLAIKGNGFLAFQRNGATYYSKDGRLTLAGDGRLLNAAGDPMLDVGGAPLQVDPALGEVEIGANGLMTQAGQGKGQIGLFDVNLMQGFQRMGASGFIPQAEATRITDFSSDGVVQGYYEDSNVNPTTAMATLIEITRAFEAVSNLSERVSEAQKSAITILGSRT